MDNEDNSTWRNESAGQNHYDWSTGQGSVSYPAGEGQPLNEVQPGAPKKNSAVVPILIALICLLSVVVVVGALVIFLQHDNDDSMDEAAVGASTSSQSSSQLTTLSANPEERSRDDAGSKVQKNAGGNVLDTCAELKKQYQNKYGIKVIGKDEKISFTDVRLEYCDGEWAATTDFDGATSGALHWNGSEWVNLPGDEAQPYAPMSPCYYKTNSLMSYNSSQKALDGMGIVFCEDLPEWREQHSTSSGNSSNLAAGSSLYDMPACDGRYVLIVESVIVPAGEDAQSKVSGRLSHYPGASVTKPGACGSLRAVDPDSGGDIYPIYYDYGFDLDAACVGLQNNANVGNVRKLSNQTEKVNLCE